MSDNALVDGITDIKLDETLSRTAEHGTGLQCVVSSYFGSSKRGYAPYNPRKKNQDALVMAEDGATGSLFLCVLDGHGECGEMVSGFFQRELSKALFAHPQFAAEPKVAFKETLKALEIQLLQDSSVDTEFSGTTMVAGIIRGETLMIFNVGDSRMTAATSEAGAVKAQALTVDHKPDSPPEKARIVAAGGRVFAVEYDDGVDGPPRVWLGHMDVPGLAMSRSLGDAVAHTAGVSSEPEIFERTIDPAKDHFIIMATDGLWEFVSDQEAIDLAASKKDPQQAVEALIREANDRWMREEQVIDDTTVCVAFFGPWAGKA